MSSKGGVDVAPFNAFTKKFYKALSNLGGNVVSSPLSCIYAVGMLYNGSNNQTRTELAKALQLPEDLDKANKKFEDISNLLKNVKDADLSLANKAYIAQDLTILQEYIGRLESSFMASAENVNFTNGDETTAKINEWVKAATKGMIENLLEQNLSGDTRLVLLNTLYFKSEWKNKFDVRKTKKAQFFSGGKKIFIETDMMQQTNQFRYADLKDQNAKFIVLPYKGADVNMLIFLPNENTGLKKLTATVYDLELQAILSLARTKFVELALPKFKIQTTIDLMPNLKGMGLGALLDDADFSGINGSKGLVVDEAIQKVVIEVNEQGTVASAATAISVLESGGVPIEFRCDRPFLYFLTHRENFVLFGGQVEDPSV